MEFLGQKIPGFALTMFYTSTPYQWCKNGLNRSSYVKVMPPTSLLALLNIMVQVDATSAPLLKHVGITMCLFLRIF
jgi:hypothetical protein